MQLIASRFLIIILFTTLITGCGSSVQSPQSLSQPLTQAKKEDVPTIVRSISMQLQREYPYANKNTIERITQDEIQKRSNIQDGTLTENLEVEIIRSMYNNFLETMRNEMKKVSDLTSPDAVEFKGIRLGSDINELSKSQMYDCTYSYEYNFEEIGDKRCRSRGQETIANVPAQLIFYYYYYDKLHYIQVDFDEIYFKSVIPAFIEKYGIGEIKTEIVQNRLGASFENKIHKWKISDTTIEARRYAGDVKTSRITYRTNYSFIEFERRIAEKGKKGVKDL